MTRDIKEISPAVGIDLGTTYSVAAVYHFDRVEIIPNEQGNRITPSIVSFNKEEQLIGEAADDNMTMNPENTIYDAKRLIGRSYDDPDVQHDVKNLSFTVINDGGRPKIQVKFRDENVTFYPEEISSMVLTKMKNSAESFLGKTIEDVVITVPAYFNDGQRQATRDAGEMVGLNVLRIMNEPIAAAIAYGLEKRMEVKRNVLIFDLGGGTFDVSILSVEGGKFEVKTYDGDSHLGGADFNVRLLDYFVNEFNRKHKTVLADKKALSILKNACERAKRSLTSSKLAHVSINNLFAGIDFISSITRSRFEELNADLFNRTIERVQRALDKVKMTKTEIDDVVLVGGSTKIPRIQKLLEDFFDGKALYKSIHPDEAVAIGAAIQATILQGTKSEQFKNFKFQDVTPLNLGIEVHGGRSSTIIPYNTAIPTKISENYTTVYDYQTIVTIAVIEGDSKKSAENKLLGKFELYDIPSMPAGKPSIMVQFHIDNDCILHVKAMEASTGKTANMRIDYANKRLTDDEKKRTVNNIEEFRRQDSQKRDFIRAWNDLEKFCFQVQEKFESVGLFSGFSKIDREIIIEKCAETIKWIEEIKYTTNSNYQMFEKRKAELQKLVNDSKGFFFKAWFKDLRIGSTSD